VTKALLNVDLRRIGLRRIRTRRCRGGRRRAQRHLARISETGPVRNLRAPNDLRNRPFPLPDCCSYIPLL